jgi:nicotinamide mononucleotide transporter
VGVAFGLALGAAMHTWTNAALPWLDAMLAALSLVAQWWQARRHTATWWLWIIVDVVYVGMYAVKSLHATAALYLVFVGLAASGLQAWKKAARQERTAGAAHP